MQAGIALPSGGARRLWFTKEVICLEYGINLAEYRRKLGYTQEGRDLCDAYAALVEENERLMVQKLNAEARVNQFLALAHEMEEAR